MSTRFHPHAKLAWLLAGLLLTVLALGSSATEAQAEPGLAYLYIGVYDDDHPFVDYEGDVPYESMGTRKPLPEDPYELTVRAEPMPGGDRPSLRFAAKARRLGKDGFTLAGDLVTTVPVRVQFVQMLKKGDSSGETFPELSFAPGTHTVRFDGQVVGWLER